MSQPLKEKRRELIRSSSASHGPARSELRAGGSRGWLLAEVAELGVCQEEEA